MQYLAGTDWYWLTDMLAAYQLQVWADWNGEALTGSFEGIAVIGILGPGDQAIIQECSKHWSIEQLANKALAVRYLLV